ncbi:hypothetical protein SUGI_0432190 [Cryptomeria japonica]|uniref:mitotic spindle checkpoint protein BUBR1 n=1 Tax=Cryptomeria japonica TaxID=3369 RepID=UPI002408B960|nr:mitotic spindle checkpoint protein BUBR1 [Cryptomeria japonica]GLJ22911.1 hypothetical protein SUGI_0432190 [Cryptomeria japonica]
MDEYEVIDRDGDHLARKQEDGNEWETYKENVKPLKGGRNVKLLNEALKGHQHNSLKHSLLDKRRELIEAIDEYTGDDPLEPWIACIKWVRESFPSGGDQSGLLSIYEQCVRAFWKEKRYHGDLRYVKTWLEYADECADPEVVYSFLDVNGIGEDHSLFYMRYATCLELKNKMKKADEIYSLGIARNAQPLEKLKNAQKQFRIRARKACKQEEDDTSPSRGENGPFRSFGTIMSGTSDTTSRQPLQSFQGARKRMKPLSERNENQNLIIYSESTNESHSSPSEPAVSQGQTRVGQQQSWKTLGTRLERNKENTAMPAKWTGNKIPQRTTSKVVAPSLHVFVDEECPRNISGGNSLSKKPSNGLVLQMIHGDLQAIKREVELLKNNPLIYFPREDLPR